MSRGRQAKSEAKTAFLDAHPESIDHDTILSVSESPFFEVIAEGEKGNLRGYNDEEFVHPLITTLDDLDTFEADFDFHTGGEDYGGHLTLTEDGFGILGEDENPIRNNGELKRDARGIEEGEVLDFDIRNTPESHLECDEEEEEFGGTAVNIDFTVLNNKSGTVELRLFQDDGPSILREFDVAQGSKGNVHNIGYVMPEGDVYDEWQFSIDGNVEVAISQIGFSTNYEGELNL